MAGLGLFPLGTAPYGLGTPAVAPILGGRILDDGQGAQTGSRAIDEASRQYVFDATGRAMGMSDARQMVLLAVATVLGSSASVTLGHDLAGIEDITADFDRRVEGALRDALAHLTSNGTIEIVAITVTRFGPVGTGQENGAYIRLRWRDLTDPKKPEHTETVK